MYALAMRAEWETLRELGFASISDLAYTAIGTAFEHPLRNLYVYNDTDQSIKLSWNGVDAFFYLPALGWWFWDITSNKTNQNGYYIAEGRKLYVIASSSAPSTGSVFVSAGYAASE